MNYSVLTFLSGPSKPILPPLAKVNHRSLQIHMTGNNSYSLPPNKAPPTVPASNAKLWAQLHLTAPALLSATFCTPDANNVAAVWSQRDVIASRKRIFSTSYIQCESSFKATNPYEHTRISTSRSYYSPSGRKIVRFTEKSPIDKSCNTLLAEVWDAKGASLENVFSIQEKTHGQLYGDEFFASVTWSPDESMIAYIAESPDSSAVTTLQNIEKDQSIADQEQNEQEDWILPLHKKYHDTAREPLGEAFVGQRLPALFVADLSNGIITELAATDDNGTRAPVILGQPQWSPDGKWITLIMRRATDVDPTTAPELDAHMPYDLGLRYCYNRFSAIVALNAPEKVEKKPNPSLLTVTTVSAPDIEEDFCCISPRFTPDGNYLLYVSAPRTPAVPNAAALPHDTTKVLRAVRLKNGNFGKPFTLISVPDNPSKDQFPGLYLYGLPCRPWLSERSLVLSSIWGSRQIPLVVDLRDIDSDVLEVDSNSPRKLIDDESGNLFYENKDVAAASHASPSLSYMSVLDVVNGTVLLSASGPVNPTMLLFWEKKDETSSSGSISGISCLSERASQLSSFLRARWTVDLVARRENGLLTSAEEYDRMKHKPYERYEATLMIPNVGDKVSEDGATLVTFPHGGPHVATTGAYSAGVMSLLMRGYAVLQINYRGSIGLGQRSLQSLPGRIGEQDVREVVQATKWAQNMMGVNSTDAVFVGGSHSGFLGAHCSLLPGLFRATVLRNPVVNVATMFGATDIPDWCLCEAGVTMKMKERGMEIRAKAYEKMLEVSPVGKLMEFEGDKKLIGKTLLQVGAGDRRVPPHQSIEWKRLLAHKFEHNVEVRWYPGSGHAIDEVPQGDDAWVVGLNFLGE